MSTGTVELPPDWHDWPLDARRALRDRLKQRGVVPWRDLARAEQLIPDGTYLTVLSGGRGSGKTRSGAEWLAEQIMADPPGAVSGIIAPTFGEARDKCVEGVSGLLPALERRGAAIRVWNRSLGELWLENDVRVKLDEAFTGAKKIQGENLRRAWCDEVGLWRPLKMAEYAWDESLLPAVRIGESPQLVCTFTPKRTPLARRLLRDEEAVVRRLRMWDNAANLAPAFLREMEKRYKGTRLGQQELEGILLEDVEGALWRFEWIEDGRYDTSLPKGTEGGPPVFWQKRRIALDPADGLADGDEQGVAVVGIGSDWDLYVIASEGLRTNPYGMCKHAIRLSGEHDGAPIIVEKNHGGEALTDLLELAMREMGVRAPYRMISASRNKVERAEPVAALYEQEHGGRRKVHHLGVFPELEEQMTSFTGEAGEPSPDRLDALVHGLVELMGHNWHGAPEPDVQDGAVVSYDSPRGPESAVVSW